MREAKAENNGAGMFRMSKEPPIGFRYLEQYCDDLERKSIVPVNLNIPVPDYSGFWYPQKAMREYFLHRLHAINKKHLLERGTNTRQWTALISTVSEVKNSKDMENLTYGPQTQVSLSIEDENFEREIVAKGDVRSKSYRAALQYSQCSGTGICGKCFAGKNEAEKAEFRNWREETVRRYEADTSKGSLNLNQWFASFGKPNPFCTLADAEWLKDIFDRRNRLRPKSSRRS
jgi:hypothetical protein